MELPENNEIKFQKETDKFLSYNDFFEMNNLLDEKYKGCTFVLFGSEDYPITLKLEELKHINNMPSKMTSILKFFKILKSIHTNKMTSIIYINNDREEEGEEYKDKDVSSLIFEQPTRFVRTRFQKGLGVSIWEKCHIVKLIIIKPDEEHRVYKREEYIEEQRGGRKASVKKEICGRLRCIYKIQGSRKEHIKYKGCLITVADYKKLMKKA